MKKIYTLLAAALLSAGAAQAATVTQTVSRITTVEQLTSADAVTATAASGDKLLIRLPGWNPAKLLKGPTTAAGNISFTNTTAAPAVGDDITGMTFKLVAVEGSTTNYYLQATSNNEYLSGEIQSQSDVNGTNGGAIRTVATTSEAAQFTITSPETNLFWFKRADVSATLYLNIQTSWESKGQVNYWTGAAGYSRWQVYKVTSTTEQEEVEVPEYLTSLDQVDQDSLAIYTIEPYLKTRGYLYADVTNHLLDACGGTDGNSANRDVAHDPSDVKQQFALIKKQGAYYLYSVGDKRFATWVNTNNTKSSLVESPVQSNGAITLQAATIGDSYVVLKIAGQYVNFSPSYNPDIYMNYNTEDGGNQVRIQKVSTVSLTEAEYNEAFAKIPGLIPVTYQAYINGAMVKEVNTTQVEGSEVSAPSDLRNDYVTLGDPDNTTLTPDADGNYIVKYEHAAVSDNCPVRFSTDYASASWYQVKFNSSDNWAYRPSDQYTDKYKGYKTVSSPIDVVNDSALWAFSGNPYAVTVLNKAAGASSALYIDGQTRPQIGEAASATTFVMGRNTLGGFYLVADGNKYLNNFGGADVNTLGVWQDSKATSDNGSNITVKQPTYAPNIFDDITAELPTVPANPKWGEVASVTESEGSDVKGFNSAKDDYNAKPNAETYAAVIAKLVKYALGGTVEAVAYTAAYKGSGSWVNISNAVVSGNSIGLKSGDYTKVHGCTTDTNDATQLWLVTSPAAGTVNLYNADARKYLGENVSGAEQTVGLSDTPVNWGITWNEDGSFVLTSGEGEDDHLNYETSEGNAGNLNQGSGNDKWNYAAVSSLNVSLHAAGDGYNYATLCLPFNSAFILDDTEIYKADDSDIADGSLTLAKIENRSVSAGTPIILRSTATSATVTITTAGDLSTAEASVLKGTMLPMAWNTDSYLSFGTSDGQPGFYKWDGETLGANKAYIDNTTAEAKSLKLVFDNIATGINGVSANAAAEGNAVRYNLAGQRVDNAFKGVVIMNGKKMLVK